MASERLYPTGARQHGPFEGIYRCYSVACLGKPELEFGDKVILPSDAFVQVSLLKLKLPLLFVVRNTQRTDYLGFEQCCGVLEFSAPAGQVYVPYWMMQNLLVQEGGKVMLRSMPQPEKGTFCRFQPHAAEFLDLAAQLGPRGLMENAMRHYSLLSKGETICVQYGGLRYYLEVVELRPGDVISLLGSLDLEVDFALPKSRKPNEDRPRTGSRIAQFMKDENEAPETRFNSWVTGSEKKESSGGSQNSTATPALPVKQTRAEAKAKEVPVALPLGEKVRGKYASKSRVAWSAFGGNGQRADGAEEAGDETVSKNKKDHSQKASPLLADDMEDSVNLNGGQQCPCCHSIIPESNYDLHVIRCQKNERYHKVPCPSCGQSMQKSKLDEHIEQIHAPVVCKLCGKTFEKQDIARHSKLECPKRLEVCQFCDQSFPFVDLKEHMEMCGVRTEQCLECKHYIKLRDCSDHGSSGECARFILADEAKAQAKADREQSVLQQLEKFAATGQGAHAINGFEAIDSVEGLLLQARRAQVESALLLKATQQKNDRMSIRNNPGGFQRDSYGEKKNGFNYGQNSAVLAALAQDLNTGNFAVGNYLDEAPSAVNCPKCALACEDYEDLQIHMLTSCTKRPSAIAEQKLSSLMQQKPNSRDSVRSVHTSLSERAAFTQWICDSCTFENDAENTECEVCDCPRPSHQRGSIPGRESQLDVAPASLRQSSSLSCPSSSRGSSRGSTAQRKPLMTPVNEFTTPKPVKQNSKRRLSMSKETSSVQQSSNSWTCQACTFKNNGNRTQCEACERFPTIKKDVDEEGTVAPRKAGMLGAPPEPVKTQVSQIPVAQKTTGTNAGDFRVQAKKRSDFSSATNFNNDDVSSARPAGKAPQKAKIEAKRTSANKPQHLSTASSNIDFISGANQPMIIGAGAGNSTHSSRRSSRGQETAHKTKHPVSEGPINADSQHSLLGVGISGSGISAPRRSSKTQEPASKLNNVVQSSSETKISHRNNIASSRPGTQNSDKPLPNKSTKAPVRTNTRKNISEIDQAKKAPSLSMQQKAERENMR